VVVVETEAEVRRVHRLLRGADRTPVTFRAAGTSLSGQALSDSVLVLLGDGWQGMSEAADAAHHHAAARRHRRGGQPRLAPLGRKIGPGPGVSIDAAMIGGIAANNASGMCCGTAQNSYKTLAGLRIVLADGTRARHTRRGQPRRLCHAQARTHAGTGRTGPQRA
jgi:D-lactate dehydrogenase